MESLLPSEVARLVYGYLEHEKCPDAAAVFLKSSKHLKECYQFYLQNGRFSTKVMGFTLLQCLDLLCTVYRIVQNHILLLENETLERCSLPEQLNFLLESRLNRNENNKGNLKLASLDDTRTNSGMVNPLKDKIENDKSRGRMTNSCLNFPTSNSTTVYTPLSLSSDNELESAFSTISNENPQNLCAVPETTRLDSLPGITKSKRKSPLKVVNEDFWSDNGSINGSPVDVSLFKKPFLDKPELQTKIVENINKALNTPEKQKSSCKEKGKSGGEQLDNVIKTVVNQLVDEDPLFDDVLDEIIGKLEFTSNPAHPASKETLKSKNVAVANDGTSSTILTPESIPASNFEPPNDHEPPTNPCTTLNSNPPGTAAKDVTISVSQSTDSHIDTPDFPIETTRGSVENQTKSDSNNVTTGVHPSPPNQIIAPNSEQLVAGNPASPSKQILPANVIQEGVDSSNVFLLSTPIVTDSNLEDTSQPIIMQSQYYTLLPTSTGVFTACPSELSPPQEVSDGHKYVQNIIISEKDPRLSSPGCVAKKNVITRMKKRFEFVSIAPRTEAKNSTDFLIPVLNQPAPIPVQANKTAKAAPKRRRPPKKKKEASPKKTDEPLIVEVRILDSLSKSISDVSLAGPSEESKTSAAESYRQLVEAMTIDGEDKNAENGKAVSRKVLNPDNPACSTIGEMNEKSKAAVEVKESNSFTDTSSVGGMNEKLKVITDVKEIDSVADTCSVSRMNKESKITAEVNSNDSVTDTSSSEMDKISKVVADVKEHDSVTDTISVEGMKEKSKVIDDAKEINSVADTRSASAINKESKTIAEVKRNDSVADTRSSEMDEISKVVADVKKNDFVTDTSSLGEMNEKSEVVAPGGKTEVADTSSASEIGNKSKAVANAKENDSYAEVHASTSIPMETESVVTPTKQMSDEAESAVTNLQLSMQDERPSPLGMITTSPLVKGNSEDAGQFFSVLELENRSKLILNSGEKPDSSHKKQFSNLILNETTSESVSQGKDLTSVDLNFSSRDTCTSDLYDKFGNSSIRLSSTKCNAAVSPIRAVNNQRQSLSTPRRKNSHVRALDFSTPPNYKDRFKRKANTSPKMSHVYSDSISEKVKHVRRSELFQSPTSPSQPLIPGGDWHVAFNSNTPIIKEASSSQITDLKTPKRESMIRSITSPLSCIKEESQIQSEEMCVERLKLPIATRSPVPKLSGGWDKVNGVGLIVGSTPSKSFFDEESNSRLSSCSKNSTSPKLKEDSGSWDARLRAMLKGDYEDPEPPKKKSGPDISSPKKSESPNSELPKNVASDTKACLKNRGRKPKAASKKSPTVKKQPSEYSACSKGSKTASPKSKIETSPEIVIEPPSETVAGSPSKVIVTNPTCSHFGVPDLTPNRPETSKCGTVNVSQSPKQMTTRKRKVKICHKYSIYSDTSDESSSDSSDSPFTSHWGNLRTTHKNSLSEEATKTQLVSGSRSSARIKTRAQKKQAVALTSPSKETSPTKVITTPKKNKPSDISISPVSKWASPTKKITSPKKKKSLDISTTPVKKARGRGRSKKYFSEPEEIVIPVEVGKRRGRPRGRSKQDFGETKPMNHPKRGRSKQEFGETKPMNHPKRGRGRPRKFIPVEVVPAIPDEKPTLTSEDSLSSSDKAEVPSKDETMVNEHATLSPSKMKRSRKTTLKRVSTFRSVVTDDETEGLLREDEVVNINSKLSADSSNQSLAEEGTTKSGVVLESPIDPVLSEPEDKLGLSEVSSEIVGEDVADPPSGRVDKSDDVSFNHPFSRCEDPPDSKTCLTDKAQKFEEDTCNKKDNNECRDSKESDDGVAAETLTDERDNITKCSDPIHQVREESELASVSEGEEVKKTESPSSKVMEEKESTNISPIPDNQIKSFESPALFNGLPALILMQARSRVKSFSETANADSHKNPNIASDGSQTVGLSHSSSLPDHRNYDITLNMAICVESKDDLSKLPLSHRLSSAEKGLSEKKNLPADEFVNAVAVKDSSKKVDWECLELKVVEKDLSRCQIGVKSSLPSKSPTNIDNRLPKAVSVIDELDTAISSSAIKTDRIVYQDQKSNLPPDLTHSSVSELRTAESKSKVNATEFSSKHERSVHSNLSPSFPITVESQYSVPEMQTEEPRLEGIPSTLPDSSDQNTDDPIHSGPSLGTPVNIENTCLNQSSSLSDKDSDCVPMEEHIYPATNQSLQNIICTAHDEKWCSRKQTRHYEADQQFLETYVSNVEYELENEPNKIVTLAVTEEFVLLSIESSTQDDYQSEGPSISDLIETDQIESYSKLKPTTPDATMLPSSEPVKSSPESESSLFYEAIRPISINSPSKTRSNPLFERTEHTMEESKANFYENPPEPLAESILNLKNLSSTPKKITSCEKSSAAQSASQNFNNVLFSTRLSVESQDKMNVVPHQNINKEGTFNMFSAHSRKEGAGKCEIPKVSEKIKAPPKMKSNTNLPQDFHSTPSELHTSPPNQVSMSLKEEQAIGNSNASFSRQKGYSESHGVSSQAKNSTKNRVLKQVVDTELILERKSAGNEFSKHVSEVELMKKTYSPKKEKIRSSAPVGTSSHVQNQVMERTLASNQTRKGECSWLDNARSTSSIEERLAHSNKELSRSWDHQSPRSPSPEDSLTRVENQQIHQEDMDQHNHRTSSLNPQFSNAKNPRQSGGDRDKLNHRIPSPNSQFMRMKNSRQSIGDKDTRRHRTPSPVNKFSPVKSSRPSSRDREQQRCKMPSPEGKVPLKKNVRQSSGDRDKPRRRTPSPDSKFSHAKSLRPRSRERDQQRPRTPPMEGRLPLEKNSRRSHEEKIQRSIRSPSPEEWFPLAKACNQSNRGRHQHRQMSSPEDVFPLEKNLRRSREEKNQCNIRSPSPEEWFPLEKNMDPKTKNRGQHRRISSPEERFSFKKGTRQSHEENFQGSRRSPSAENLLPVERKSRRSYGDRDQDRCRQLSPEHRFSPEKNSRHSYDKRNQRSHKIPSSDDGLFTERNSKQSQDADHRMSRSRLPSPEGRKRDSMRQKSNSRGKKRGQSQRSPSPEERYRTNKYSRHSHDRRNHQSKDFYFNRHHSYDNYSKQRISLKENTRHNSYGRGDFKVSLNARSLNPKSPSKECLEGCSKTKQHEEKISRSKMQSDGRLSPESLKSSSTLSVSDIQQLKEQGLLDEFLKFSVNKLGKKVFKESEKQTEPTKSNCIKAEEEETDAPVSRISESEEGEVSSDNASLTQGLDDRSITEDNESETKQILSNKRKIEDSSDENTSTSLFEKKSKTLFIKKILDNPKNMEAFLLKIHPTEKE